VLLHLLRGAGVAGLAGIPRASSLGDVRLLRPLLDLPRSALLGYARQAGLTWIEDPSNTDASLDRNYLRHRVLPLLESRWPGLRATIGRSARLAGEAAALIDAVTEQDSRRAVRRGRLSVAGLASLEEPRRRNVVRSFCRQTLGSAPADTALRAGLAQLLAAGHDRQPLLAWPGGEIRRYRGWLFVLRPLAALPARTFELQAKAGACIDLGSGLGRLRLVRARGRGLACAKLAPSLTVRFRKGGERIRLPGERHNRELKKLLQENGVLPWMRPRIPLLYSGGELAAVGGLWIAEQFAARAGDAGLRVRWEGHPPTD
jgi:tRNA(Ile)-lysidine synthase